MCVLQLAAELDGLERSLANQAVGPNANEEGDRLFDGLSSTFKQFIVQGKDWLGNAKNLVSVCPQIIILRNYNVRGCACFFVFVQWIYVVVQHFNSVLLHDSFAEDDRS